MTDEKEQLTVEEVVARKAILNEVLESLTRIKDGGSPDVPRMVNLNAELYDKLVRVVEAGRFHSIDDAINYIILTPIIMEAISIQVDEPKELLEIERLAAALIENVKPQLKLVEIYENAKGNT